MTARILYWCSLYLTIYEAKFRRCGRAAKLLPRDRGKAALSGYALRLVMSSSRRREKNEEGVRLCECCASSPSALISPKPINMVKELDGLCCSINTKSRLRLQRRAKKQARAPAGMKSKPRLLPARQNQSSIFSACDLALSKRGHQMFVCFLCSARLG